MSAENDWQAAEAAAAVDSRGIIPLEATTLQFVPADARWQFERKTDGTGFVRRYVSRGDKKTQMELVDRIATGDIEIVDDGVTNVPAWRAEQERIKTERQEAIQREIKRLEDLERDKRLAAAAQAKALADARHEAERARILQSYGLKR